MNSKRVLIALAVFIVALVVINYLVRPPVTYDIRVVTPPSIIPSLPHWVAVEKGFYKEAGLNVLTIDITNSTLMVQALTTGDADVLPAVALVDVINAKASPNRPLIFSHSRLKTEPPFDALIVMRGSPISNLKELEGKKIAVYPGPTAQAAAKMFLERNNVNVGAIQFVTLPPPEHINSLQRGDVAASYMYEPLLTANLETGKVREISNSIYASLQDPSAIGVSVLSSRFFTDRNEVAKRYLAVWDRSIQFIRDHPAEARDILASRLKITKDVAQKATWVDATRVDEVDRNAVRATASLFQQVKVMESVEIDDSFFLPSKK
jgi:ABC-type nitrate/sulfonate/bicarbonate transport system substrate-binding protein